MKHCHPAAPPVALLCLALVTMYGCDRVEHVAPPTDMQGVVLTAPVIRKLNIDETIELTVWTADSLRTDWRATFTRTASDRAIVRLLPVLETAPEPLPLESDSISMYFPRRALERIEQGTTLIVSASHPSLVVMENDEETYGYGELYELSALHRLRDGVVVTYKPEITRIGCDRIAMMEITSPEHFFIVYLYTGCRIRLGRTDWAVYMQTIGGPGSPDWKRVVEFSDRGVDRPRVKDQVGWVYTFAQNGFGVAQWGARPRIAIATEYERRIYGFDRANCILDLVPLLEMSLERQYTRDPDAQRMLHPCLFLWENQPVLLYTAFDGGSLTICAATSRDGRTWTRQGAVLRGTQERVLGEILDTSDFDAAYVSHPLISAWDDTLWMCYRGWNGRRGGASHKLGFATSSDGLEWERRWSFGIPGPHGAVLGFARSNGGFLLWALSGKRESGDNEWIHPDLLLYRSADGREWSEPTVCSVPFPLGETSLWRKISTEVVYGPDPSGCDPGDRFTLYSLTQFYGLRSARSSDGVTWHANPVEMLP